MKKYDLVISLSLEELIQVVNEAIQVGYYPKGGMQLVEGKYVQTIYLRDEEIENKYELKKIREPDVNLSVCILCKNEFEVLNGTTLICTKCKL